MHLKIKYLLVLCMLILVDCGDIILASTVPEKFRKKINEIYYVNNLNIEKKQNIGDEKNINTYPDILDYPDIEEEINEDVDQVISEKQREVRFTFKHQFGYKYQYPKKWVANRCSLRLELTNYIKKNHLLLCDGKATIHYPYDNMAKSSKSESDAQISASLREMYLLSSYNSLSFRLGRQIIKWGESEISVVDELSPKNLEEMYFVATEDERIGQLMVECGYFSKGQESFFFVNPDSQVNKLPPKNTEYYTELPEDSPGYIVSEKRSNEIEYGLRSKHYLSNGDISIIFANLNDNSALYQSKSINKNVMYMDKLYGRYQLFAIAGNLNYGNILLKGELAYKMNKEFLKTVFINNDSIVERNAIDCAMDIEYLTNGNTTLRLGSSNSHIIGWENTFKKNQNEAIFFLGMSKSFLNDTLETEYLLTYEDATGDIVHKLTTEYLFKQDISVKLNLYYFHPDNEYTFLDNGGRVTVDIKCYF